MPDTTNGGGALFGVMGVIVAFLVILAIVTADRGQDTLTQADKNGQLTAAGVSGIRCYLSFREANPDTVESVGNVQLDKCMAKFDRLAKDF